MNGRVRTLADLGESALIERIVHRTGRTLTREWALGIGDDAAILTPRPGFELVFSSDAQVEGVHFRFGRETPRTIGRRALAVNLSDLAAMGAAPVGALLSLSAPPRARLSDFDRIIEGFVEESETYGCPLVGGNLSRADVWSLHVTVVGCCRKGKALRRRGLSSDDDLFVTGELGAAALARMRADHQGTRTTRVPTPRLAAGIALSRMKGTRACIDLSDGLSTDLAHLLAENQKGAEIQFDCVPRPRGFTRGCRALGIDPAELLCSGGEDYELLFAFRSQRNSDPEGMLSQRLGVPVRRIGRVTSESGLLGLPALGVAHHF